MDKNQLLQLLESLGTHLGKGAPIEIHVLGGAAGLLTGLLPGYMTTSDIDVVHIRPHVDVEELLAAAEQVADAIGANRGWMNIDAGLYSNAIPDGWENRRVVIGRFGRLYAYALGRVDLIATKFFAHRTRDREHLLEMRVTAEEKDFVRRHLESLPEIMPNQTGQIDMALHILNEWT